MYIERNFQDEIYRSFKSSFISALLGPRRVGKSTLVKHFTQQHPNHLWVVLNMDKMIERQRCEKGELRAIIQEQALSIIGDNKKIGVVVDEAQKCPSLFDQVKILYDEFKDSTFGIKFILTGSGSLSLHQLSAETLAGRIEILYLREFSLREVTILKNNVEIPKVSILDAAVSEPRSVAGIIDKLSPFKPLLLEALDLSLIRGGLPEAIQQNSMKETLIYLGNYLQTYLEKDVRAVQEITNLPVYQKLIEIVAVQTGSIREDKKILESLGCSRETLKKYRGYLIATLMFQEIYPFIDSTLKRLTKSPKGFLLNNGLISFLTGYHDLDVLKKTGSIGHRFENWLLQTLDMWLDKTIGQHQIYYWRTSGGVEVDFVLDKKPNVFPFEITFTKQIDSKKVKHLIEFMKEEKRCPQGFYVYNGHYEYDPEIRIHFLPAWVLL